MSTVTRTLVGGKDALVEHLGDQHRYKLDEADNPRLTLRERARIKGYAAGLEYAMGAVEDWVMGPEALAAALAELERRHGDVYVWPPSDLAATLWGLMTATEPPHIDPEGIEDARKALSHEWAQPEHQPGWRSHKPGCAHEGMAWLPGHECNDTFTEATS
jgi:hypothetical protein